MAYLQTQIEKPMDGPVYYAVVTLLGMMFTILAGINIFQEGVFSMRMIVGGILTAAGARLYNRVLVPRYQLWKSKKRAKKRNDENDPKPDQSAKI